MDLHETPIQVGLSTDVCVMAAAERFRLPADLLFAVRAVERGMPGHAVLNTNGTSDFNEPGLNTQTIKELERRGWDAQRLYVDGCYAMNASAFWMRIKLAEVAGRAELTLLQRVAGYNSRTPSHNAEYQRRLIPHILNWGCYLNVYWGYEPESLFGVHSGLIDREGFGRCKR